MTPRRNILALALSTVVVAGGLVFASLVLAQEGHENHGHEQETIYTCGMHPNIVEAGPGTCPICGMDLTPKKIAGNSNTQSAKSGANESRKIKHWVAPMDPTFVADKPGKSPMGMDLVPVYEGGGNDSTITIDPTVVQNMGVRIKRVEQGTIFRHIRTVGTIEVAEDEISVVNLRYSGWIERIYVDETGVKVKKGDVLFDIYSPELVSAQEEYLLALRTSAKSPLANSARRRLGFFGLTSWHIKQIEKLKTPLRTLHVVAPQNGYVLHKNVVQGARVNAGSDLYRIGNLAKIWVNAEVYEFDAAWVRLGERATMELSFQQGKVYEGSVSYIHPTLNRETRTLKVRLEFENPGLALKPGMFAIVQIDAQRRNNITIAPTEAIIHSGTRQLVFVALELGHYEMREITTGVVGDRYMTEVLSGLEPGERIVSSGQFLLDSESQLQEAVQKLLAARLHAKEKRVMGDAHPAPEVGETGSYYTCGMHPQIVQDESGTCPICGMDLTKKKK